LGVWSAELGVWSAELGVWSAEWHSVARFLGDWFFRNHRNNYLNLIRCMEKLIRLQVSDKVAVSAFRESLKKEEILSEKTFFLGLLPPTPPDTP